MKNKEIANIFYDIADLLELKDVAWKPIAFRKAARTLENLGEDVEEIYKRQGIKGLKEIPTIGEGLAKKIAEFVEHNKIKDYEDLKRSIPIGLMDRINIQGLGPKKAYKLYKELNIDSIKKLETAARKGKIQKLEGFGEKSEEDILVGLELFKRGQERMILGNALEISNSLLNKLKKLKEIKKIDIAGSIRRRKEVIRDIDILVASENPKKVMDFFTRLENVDKVLAKGTTKSSVVLKEGINSDLRIVEQKSYGAALNYLTGSKDHNVALRQIAIKEGYKLSEYGLFKAGKYVAGKTEREVYKKLGLEYIEPELRENNGEIEASKKNKLPKLLKQDSIKGDLHMHTTWSDGNYSTEEMIKEAERIGYGYIAITDHSKSSYVANGLDEKRLMQHIKEIDKLSKKHKIRVFKGAEVDILKDGSLDYSDKLLKQLDVIIASIHSRFKDNREEMTKRILGAIKNKHVAFIAHPTGRLINQRNPYDIDFGAIVEAARENNVALEINSFPSRLDLNDSLIRRAVENKTKLVINTDSHSVEHFKFIELGVAQARRGWAEEKDIINTLPLNKLERFLDRA